MSNWIDANIKKPPLIEGQDFSDNVWGWDASDKRLLVVKYYNDSEGCRSARIKDWKNSLEKRPEK